MEPVDAGRGSGRLKTEERMDAEISKVVSQGEVRKAWSAQGAVPMTMNPAEFETYLNADIAKWKKVVEISGARADR